MQNRRTFMKRSLAGALLLGATPIVGAGFKPARPTNLLNQVMPKPPKPNNPFQLGMAGYTFLNFDLDTTLKTMQRLDIRYLCIKDFHLPLDSNDEQIKAFHAKCAEHGVTGYAVGPIYMRSGRKLTVHSLMPKG